MAIKIPDAPGIIGSEPVLRQGANLRGVSTIPDFSINTSAEREMLNDVGKAWALFEEDQNATYMTAWKSDFTQFASATATKIKNGHKGRAATNLYARQGGFKDQVDKWVEDRLGPDKNDGKLRIANKALKQRALAWVDSQKSSWISHFANYEASEYDKYRTTAFEANDQANANLVLNAMSDEEIGNAIEGMFQTAKWQYQGMDPRYISNVAGKKADEAVAAYVRTMIPSDPYSAAVRVQNIDGNWKNASGALTSTTRAKLMKEIQDSYIKNGANNYALADSDVVRYEVLDDSIVSQLWETADPLVIDRIQDNIRADGEKIRAAREKETAGLQAREVSNIVTQFNNAKTVDDLWSTMQTAVESGHPELAESFQDMYVDKLNMLKTVDDATAIGPDLEELYQQYYQEELDKEERAIADEKADISKRLEKAYNPSIWSVLTGERTEAPTKEEMRVLSDTNRTNERRARENASRRAKERVLGSPTRASAPGSDVELDKAIMEKQDADRAAFEKYHNMLEARKASMPVFTELYSEQADGVAINVTDDRFRSLPADLREELLLQRQTVTDYQNLVDKVPEVDTVLNALPDYKKMSMASQGLLKRFVVEDIKKKSFGTGATGIPEGEALKQLILQSAAKATVKEEKQLRNAIERNSQYDNGWDVDFRDAESALVYSALGKNRTVKNNTYDLQRKQAEAIINDFAASLDRNPRKVVEDMRDDMIQWIIDGNYDQVIYFVRGFTKRENM